MRAFYIIGHNPNTADDAIAYLKAGANALEPDLRWDEGEVRVHDQIVLGGRRLRYPPFSRGPALREYLRELRRSLERHAGLNLALIAWDLKEPFELGWMREALDTIRVEFTAFYPKVPCLFTVGEPQKNGFAALLEFSTLLQSGEAIGVDDKAAPEEVDRWFAGNVGVPYAFADGINAETIGRAVRLRNQGNSFRFVYAWTLGDELAARQFLDLDVDGMIVDNPRILGGELARPFWQAKYRLAVAEDNPFLR